MVFPGGGKALFSPCVVLHTPTTNGHSRGSSQHAIEQMAPLELQMQHTRNDRRSDPANEFNKFSMRKISPSARVEG